MEEDARREHERRISLYGPQLDLVEFYLDGLNAQQFASQGQQRSLVLAFKMAQVELIAERLGQNPVLLLDDVMSELDRSRREYLLGGLTGRQVFITACDDSLLWETSDAEVVAVRNGEFYPGGFPICEEEG